MNSQTCTCPDWKNKRSSFGINSPFRFCKHLCAFYEETGTELPQELKPFESVIYHFAMEERGVPVADNTEQILLSSSDGSFADIGIVVTKYDDNDWVNLYFGGTEYGYNIYEKRWSCRKEPPAAQAIIRNSKLIRRGKT